MTVVAKLSGFLVVLTAVFGVAFLTGTQSATLLAPPAVHDNTLGGLSGSVDGYTLTSVEPELEPGPDQFVELRLVGPDGAPAAAGRGVAPPAAPGPTHRGGQAGRGAHGRALRA